MESPTPQIPSEGHPSSKAASGRKARLYFHVILLISHGLLSCILLVLLIVLLYRSIPTAIEKEAFPKELVLSHLRGVGESLHQENAAERMQEIFPEGASFMYTLYGMAWSNALPHLSSGERAEGLAELRFVLERQLDPVVVQPFTDTEVHRGVFWLGQRNLILGHYLKALPVEERPANWVTEFQANSRALYDAFRASNTHHLNAYPGLSWAADNVTALRSLLLHDELYATNYRQAYEEWKAWTITHFDPETELPASHLNTSTGFLLEPARGCTNSWIIPLIAEVDPEFAKELSDRYLQHFAIRRLGYRILREWPESHEGQSGDIDSGPVVWDAGMTATGVGLAMARSQGDTHLEADIRDLSHLFGFPSQKHQDGLTTTKYLYGMLPVGDAFLAWGYSIQRAEAQSLEIPTRMQRLLERWPWFEILSLGLLLLIIFSVWRGKRLLKSYRDLKASYLAQTT
ncbi:MAG: hypothetical protein SFY68_11100 [Candidatus Sumerlaeia bacterium]|nr:hypothetical protein [Candidatus Sumerlaeia bacterium]